MDGDGDLDLVAGEGDAATTQGEESDAVVAVYVNNGTGTFTRQVAVGGLSWDEAAGVQVIDLNGDQRSDLLYRVSGAALVYRPHLPGGEFGATVAIYDDFVESKYPISSFKTADKDGDGDLDIFLTDDGAGEMLVLQNGGAGNFAVVSSGLPVGPYSGVQSVVDVNGDGRVDVLITGYDENFNPQATVALQGADGSFAAPTLVLPVDDGVYAAEAGDFNKVASTGRSLVVTINDLHTCSTFTAVMVGAMAGTDFIEATVEVVQNGKVLKQYKARTRAVRGYGSEGRIVRMAEILAEDLVEQL